ncbi:MAG: guanylate kinase [Phycisphaerae bacterium]
MRRGRLLVISGPSGAGKTSICDGLLETVPRARWSVSVTTRPRRGNEVDGEAYRFITRAEYDRMVAAGELLEHAEYLGNGYGTPLNPVRDAIANGDVLILEIDVQGAEQVARKMPDSIRVFILPPTMETLQARLQGRKTESDAIQKKRLAEADGEIAFARNSGVYPYVITNDILDDSIQQVHRILTQEMATP